jgi:hypothetical protein
MSDRILSEHEIAEALGAMTDGQTTVEASGEVLRLLVKCSHVADGACTACLQPVLTGFLRMATDMGLLKRALRDAEPQIRALEAVAEAARGVLTPLDWAIGFGFIQPARAQEDAVRLRDNLRAALRALAVASRDEGETKR